MSCVGEKACWFRLGGNGVAIILYQTEVAFYFTNVLADIQNVNQAASEKTGAAVTF
jgi:hypothetical protein